MVSHNSFLTYVVLYDKTETRIYGVYVVLCKCYAGKVLNNLLSYPDDVLKIAIYAAHMAQVRSAGSEARD